MKKDLIYLDNAATTKISDKVFEAMLPWLKESYGNASTLYSLGRNAAMALSKARASCAEALGCEPCEVFFTSGGSESDNWAIRSTAELMGKKGKKHIITSAIEHHAVLKPLTALEKSGFEVTYLPVYENGIVRTEDIAEAIRPDTALVTVMYANNEIGTIQPVEEIGALCRERNILFHTDSVQAAGNVHIKAHEKNIDMLSLSGHKIHAMKGIGLLYVKKSLDLPPFISGGEQQSGKRAGTENIAGIVGLAAALTEAESNIDSKREKLLPLREKMIDKLSSIECSHLNGDIEKRLAGNVNFSFEGIEGESALLQLDLKGIAASSGSACASGSLEPSHVLLALGLPSRIAKGSLRFTMSEYTTENEIDTFLEVFPAIVDKLRSMSAEWKRIKEL